VGGLRNDQARVLRRDLYTVQHRKTAKPGGGVLIHLGGKGTETKLGPSLACSRSSLGRKNKGLAYPNRFVKPFVRKSGFLILITR